MHFIFVAPLKRNFTTYLEESQAKLKQEQTKKNKDKVIMTPKSPADDGAAH